MMVPEMALPTQPRTVILQAESRTAEPESEPRTALKFELKLANLSLSLSTSLQCKLEL
jgi:hypothetical protein